MHAHAAAGARPVPHADGVLWLQEVQRLVCVARVCMLYPAEVLLVVQKMVIKIHLCVKIVWPLHSLIAAAHVSIGDPVVAKAVIVVPVDVVVENWRRQSAQAARRAKLIHLLTPSVHLDCFRFYCYSNLN